MTEINIDFQIFTTHDPKVITVRDTSVWAQLENKPSIIEVLLPGEIIPVVHYFDKYRDNIFNSHMLGLLCSTCSENQFINLPDGIYHFTVKGSPDTFNLTRQYLKTDSTRLDLDKFISSIDFNCSDFSKDVVNKIQTINFYLEAAESNTRMGDYSTAQDLLFRAQKMISRLQGCKVCV